MADLASRITRPDAAAPAGDVAANGSKPAAEDDGTGLLESKYEVEVKLSDLQGDSDNPLSSVSSFEELGLFVFRAPLLC